MKEESVEYIKFFEMDKSFKLQSGENISRCKVCYETYGQLSKERDNAILIFHALSGDSHVASHFAADRPGWWDICVGAGKSIDTDKYFIICANVLGGCSGSTGPDSINPETGSIYGPTFPEISIEDMAGAQKALIDSLHIEKLYAIIGGSMGGQLALAWSTLFPGTVTRIAIIASSHRLSSQALAFDIVGRNAIQHDENYYNGNYAEHGTIPRSGLAIARMIGHITYLSAEGMRTKFESSRSEPTNIQTSFEKIFSVGSYLGYQGDKFVERFDANSYITLTKALDRFDLGATSQEIITMVKEKDAQWLIISFSSDWLFPPADSLVFVEALVQKHNKVSYHSIKSSAGHDAFLLNNDLDKYGALMSAFLQKNSFETDTCCKETGIAQLDFSRKDLSLLPRLISKGAKILDLGSGNGDLLSCLKTTGASTIQGIDLDFTSIVESITRGIPVIQYDLNQKLSFLPDRHFDYVILSLTLQAIKDIIQILTEIIRIGNKAIVSFPNFGYYKLREMFYKKGKAPNSAGILHFEWFNTPNIRFFSIDDFYDLCQQLEIKIDTAITIDTESQSEIKDNPNLNADLAIFVISKK